MRGRTLSFLDSAAILRRVVAAVREATMPFCKARIVLFLLYRSSHLSSPLSVRVCVLESLLPNSLANNEAASQLYFELYPARKEVQSNNGILFVGTL